MGGVGVVRSLPDLPDDQRDAAAGVRVVGKLFGEVAPPDPAAVDGEPSSVVEAALGGGERAGAEVGAVVVDVVEDLVLHPGGGALHQPDVLVGVVSELDGIGRTRGRRSP